MRAHPYEFNGKVAVVTGGTMGIGFGAARSLAQGGANVVICGSRPDAGEEAAQRLCDEGLPVVFKKANVRFSSEIQELIRYTADTYGRLDILVNSAGVQRYGDVTETSEEVWDEVIDINLKGMFLSCKYAIPEMRKGGGGAIVNVSSVQAFASQKGVAAYTASKGGINAMTRAMALDHAQDNIRVNVVCPASIDTPMLRWAADLHKGESSQEQLLADWGKMHPIGRVGTMEEVGELIAFLASDRAGFITGAEYKIDGGMLAALGVHLPE
ncbi:SDR family NAD(P)-dependent oxidoreductase [Cohnella silvisoli]|uniref:SDR family NAD(P)-dependent oxidoreductase n=1 Tax=Cohnella silvisoli TaxID=2873699 RepID=A0ABV1KVU5_9BACL|nr:SDR family NAD(P)-dependent oxidoreductase [Cohnella silvisoli]MCD9023632.1 SDR family oxidoreductase [Cohnella silvisoli]